MKRAPALAFFGLLLTQFLSFNAHAACSSPAANIGSLDFQSSAFKYCDGTNWQALSGATSFPLTGPNGTATGPTYSFSAGTNTGMYSTGVGTLAFTTAGTQAMTITNIGRIGVGTSAPAVPLEIITNSSGFGLRVNRSGGATVDVQGGGSAGWIGTPSNHPLYFFTNNSSQQMILTTAGSLGIGASPNRLLHVAGDARFTSNVAMGNQADVNTSGIFYNATSIFATLLNENRVTTATPTYVQGVTSYLEYDPSASAAAVEIYAADFEVQSRATNTQPISAINGMYLTSEHKGTGAVSTLAGLVVGTSLTGAATVDENYGIVVHPNKSAGTINKRYALAVNTPTGSATTHYGLYLQDQTGGGSTSYNIYSMGSSSKNYFEGNVGIGTTAPNAPLDVNGVIATTGAGNNYLRFKNTSNGANQQIAEWLQYDNVFRGRFVNDAYNTSSDFMDVYRTAGSHATQYVVFPTGRVGMGTASPGAELEVADTAGDSDARINIRAAAGGSQTMQVGRSTTQGLIDTQGAPLYIYTLGTSTPSFGILASGRVGIGTATPGYNLHVVGNAGLSTGTAWTNASDSRLKNIDGDYEYGLDEVLKLHSVRFHYKEGNALGLPSTHPMTGFIAQEVQKVIPDAVSVGEKGYLQLNVDPIHWATVNAVQELHGMCKATDDRVLVLEQKNAKLENRVQELESRLERLEKLVQPLIDRAPADAN